MKRKHPDHAVIFDFDGTLADTRKPIMQSIWGALHDLKVKIPSQRSLNTLSCHTLEGMFKKLGIRSQDKIDCAIKSYNRRYRSLGPKKARLYPGVKDTLSCLKGNGYHLFIGTHEKRSNLDRLVNALDIGNFFSDSLCEDEVEHIKPAPEMAETLMGRNGVQPEDTLVVGDSTLDIRMGKAARCKTCAVTYGVHSKVRLAKHNPNCKINAFPELLNVLELSEPRHKRSNG
jgi:phosphoglycolate phosphatase